MTLNRRSRRLRHSTCAGIVARERGSPGESLLAPTIRSEHRRERCRRSPGSWMLEARSWILALERPGFARYRAEWARAPDPDPDFLVTDPCFLPTKVVPRKRLSVLATKRRFFVFPHSERGWCPCRMMRLRLRSRSSTRVAPGSCRLPGRANLNRATGGITQHAVRNTQ